MQMRNLAFRDMRLPRLGAMRSGGFSPASLFAGGTEGAWYDPSDLSTLFQDSAGTTPVTASGQPVGKMLDKSGRANHATQAISAQRPTYTEGSGLSWLAFDGVGDAMATAAIDFTGTDKMSVFAAIYKPSDSGQKIICELTSKSTNAGAFSLFTGDTNTSRRFAWSTADPQAFIGTADFAGAVTAVQSVLFDRAGATTLTQIFPRVNGAIPTLTEVVNANPEGSFANDVLNTGSRNGAQDFFHGNMYGLIVRGAASTAAEVASTEVYLASNSGVTL